MGESDAIYTFGGDRETFNLKDPLNYLNVDNDVWKFSLPHKLKDDDVDESFIVYCKNSPNPFSGHTNFSYEIQNDSHVALYIHNSYGKFIKQLINNNQSAGKHECTWNGDDSKGKNVKRGIYFAKFSVDDGSKIVKVIKSD